MVKNHENLQFCGFRNPEKKTKSPYFSNFRGFWEALNCRSKIKNICNFVLSGIRKIGQKALILAILKGFGTPNMVKNHENLQFCALRKPLIKPKSLHFANCKGFWDAQTGQKAGKSAILRFPESAT